MGRGRSGLSRPERCLRATIGVEHAAAVAVAPSENRESIDKVDEMQDGQGTEMMRKHHQMTLWAPFAVIALGGFVALAPLAFDYRDGWLAASDIVSGLLLVALGYRSLSPAGGLARWGATAVGIWLMFVPLLFWAPTAASYAIGTLVGALAIAFSILIPGMPGMRMLDGPTTPPGWSYNPSSWPQRLPPIAAALAAFLVARYMAGYQLGHGGSTWDPFFGDGSERVLTSDVSKMFPISDAGLGAFAYMLEALSGFMGGTNRWRTMPWMVLMFFILVVPLGIVSIVLVILQPLAVGTFCTPCLVTAMLMLVMIPFAVDEVVAMAQFLANVRRRGDSVWTNFWRGGTLEGEGARDEATLPAPLAKVACAARRGVNFAPSLLASAALGIALMFLPPLFGVEAGAAEANWLFGPLIVTFAVTAMADVVRPLRFVNVLLALAAGIAPFLIGERDVGYAVTTLVVAVVVLALSLPRAAVGERYERWNERIA